MPHLPPVLSPQSVRSRALVVVLVAFLAGWHIIFPFDVNPPSVDGCARASGRRLRVEVQHTDPPVLKVGDVEVAKTIKVDADRAGEPCRGE